MLQVAPHLPISLGKKVLCSQELNSYVEGQDGHIIVKLLGDEDDVYCVTAVGSMRRVAALISFGCGNWVYLVHNCPELLGTIYTAVLGPPCLADLLH